MSRPNAFTLMELLIVMSIIAILAAIVVPVLGIVRCTAKESAAQSVIRGLEMALESYKLDTGLYPEDAGGSPWNTRTMVLRLGDPYNDPGLTQAGPNAPYYDFRQSDLDAGGDFIDPFGGTYRYRENLSVTRRTGVPSGRKTNKYDICAGQDCTVADDDPNNMNGIDINNW